MIRPIPVEVQVIEFHSPTGAGLVYPPDSWNRGEYDCWPERKGQRIMEREPGGPWYVHHITRTPRQTADGWEFEIRTAGGDIMSLRIRRISSGESGEGPRGAQDEACAAGSGGRA